MTEGDFEPPSFDQLCFSDPKETVENAFPIL